jgi:hypothetical protein
MGYTKNNEASIVQYRTPISSYVFGNLDNTFATMGFLPGLYITLKSYFRNIKIHLAIFLNVCGLLTMYINVI